MGIPRPTHDPVSRFSPGNQVTRRELIITSLPWIVLWTTGASTRLLAEAASGNSENLTYRTGYAASVKFGIELYRALKSKYRPLVYSRPINVATDDAPFIRLEEFTDPEVGQPMGMVIISAGFIDLVNNVAHAKAIDAQEKGYFSQYVLSLARETGERELRELPRLADSRYWTREMMNAQLSNFNQIVGVLVGMKLANYYLGHYKKYESQLRDPQGHPVPINGFLTPAEWDEALKRGVVNALDCGLATDGVQALFESLARMSTRPAWTRCFLSENVKVGKLKKDLERIEKRYFDGERFEE